MKTEMSALCAEKGVTIETLLVKLPEHALSVNSSQTRIQFMGPPSEDWDKSAFHWTVKLTFQGRTLTASYKTGCGHVDKAPGIWRHNGPEIKKVREPSAADVLSSLVSDAQAGAESFEGFCGNFGYDTDSRKALNLYLACQNSLRDVRKLLGADFALFENAEH